MSEAMPLVGEGMRVATAANSQVSTAEAPVDEATALAIAQAREKAARKPEEVAAGVDPANPNGDTDPISASAMRGEPITIGPIGLAGITLTVKPLKRKDIREKLNPLISQWPNLFQNAIVLPSPPTGGIDFAAVSRLLTSMAGEGVEITPEEVAGQFRQVVVFWEAYEEAMNNTAYLFTDAGGMEREAVDTALDELEVDEFPDLLRALLDSLGRFRGNYSERFEKP